MRATNKIVIFFLFFFLASAIASSVPGSWTNFYQQSSVVNQSFGSLGLNQSYYAYIPIGNNIITATIALSGKNYTNINNKNYTNGINVTTYSGFFTVGANNPQNANDGDFNTYAEVTSPVTNSYYLVNFTVLNATNEHNVTFKYQLRAASNNNFNLTCRDQTSGAFVNVSSPNEPANPFVDVTLNVYVPRNCYISSPRIDFNFTTSPNGGGSIYFYDIKVIQLIPSNYSKNFSMYVNNILAYNYGASNASNFDHNVTINFTTNLSTISLYPSRFDFISSTSGSVVISNLNIQDTVRNFTFNFYDERDGSTYKLNLTNSTKLKVYCVDSIYEYPVTSGTTLIGLLCSEFNFLKAEVIQNDETYYRTKLVPPSGNSTPTVDFYLVNLNNNSVTQVIIKLTDLNGKWQNSRVDITKYVNSTYASIIEQRFDIDNRVYLWLMNNENYNITVTNSFGEVYKGSFIADQAEIKNLALPTGGFYDSNYLEDDIRYVYEFNATTGIVRFYYYDTGGLTSSVQMNFSYPSNNSLIYTATLTGDFTSGAVFTIPNTTLVRKNQSYVIKWKATHSALGDIQVSKTFADYDTLLEFNGFTYSEYNNIFKWAGFILMIVLLVSFGQSRSHWGIIACLLIGSVLAIMGIFNVVSAVIFSIFAILTFLLYLRRTRVQV